MLIPISEISVNAGRRDAVPKDIQELADSISEIGLLHPITVDSGHTLIAGLHRLEAAKLLGWTEIECMVSDLDGLQAELAEIDENFVRADLSLVDCGNLLLRRKEIYETLHPEAKDGGDRRSENFRTKNFRSDSVKSFAQDTAKKLGVTPRTVEMQVQAAKNLTAEAKSIIKGTDTKITKTDAIKLSRLTPEQQGEAASQLAAGEIKSIVQYQPPAEIPEVSQEESVTSRSVPYSLGNKHFATLEGSEK